MFLNLKLNKAGGMSLWLNEILNTEYRYGKGATSREDFNETWLTESPKRVSPAEYYSQLVKDIAEFIEYGKEPIQVRDNLYKLIMLDNSLIYYIMEHGSISIGIELEKRPQGMIIRLVGKNPELKGPPYASALYKLILEDIPANLKLLSDQTMTDSGITIWKRLFKDDYRILVYDSDNPGSSHQLIKGIDEFNLFFDDANNFKKYQFVLTSPKFLGETVNYFSIRRFRELSGLL